MKEYFNLGLHTSILLCLCILSVFNLSAQVIDNQSDTVSKSSGDTLKKTSKIKVKNADNFIAERLDGKDYQYFRGNVKMLQDSIYMFADSAFIFQNQMTAVGEVIIIQDDTINVFADSLFYDSDLKQANLYDNVVLKTDDKTLFTNTLEYNLETKQAIFRDTALLQRGFMTLSSLRGRYDVGRKRAYFYDQVVIKDKDIELTSDSLDYDTDIDRAYFKGPTYIQQEGKQIYCEAGYYDLITKYAFFSQNAVIVEGSSVAFADDILYSDADSTITFTGQAEVLDSTSLAKGDKIIFNDKTGQIEIIGQAYYKNDDQVIEGEEIYYNKTTEDLLCIGRTTVSGDNGALTADSITYTKAIDIGTAVGTAEWVDTVEHRTILADQLFYSDSTSYFKAITIELRPLYFQEVDGDTLYVSADTLVSAEPSDSLKYLEAINGVQIYKSDLQAVCDSLYYSSIDSSFTLFGSPVCWSDTTQFKGDTIVILLKNDKVSQIIAKKKAYITTMHLAGYYDQIKGRYIHTYMQDNKLDKMVVKGNAEALYLLKDEEEAYIGANKTLCSQMTFYFIEDELDNIKFYSEPESQMTPMDKATDKDLKLEGFEWLGQRRPQGVEGMRVKPSPRLTRPSPSEDIDSFEADVIKILENEGFGQNSRPDSGQDTKSKKNSKELQEDATLDPSQAPKPTPTSTLESNPLPNAQSPLNRPNSNPSPVLDTTKPNVPPDPKK